MRIAILGGPGSGKGTQARMLSQRYRVPHISTGDLLREAIKNDIKFGQQVEESMDSGHLVDDNIVLKLLDDRLRKKDTKRGFIIDGYPRNIPQAQSLDALLGLLGRALQISVNMDVDDDVLVKRISGRLMCLTCDAIFNKYYNPTKKRGICDECEGKEFKSRGDDSQKTAEVRVQVYHDSTFPLIAYYKAQHKLRTVMGAGDIDEIQKKLCDIIDLEIRPLEIKSVEMASETHEEIDSTIIAGGQVNTVAVEKRKKPKKKKKVVTKVTSAAASAKAKKPVAKKNSPKKQSTVKAVTKPSAKKTSSKKSAVKVTPKKPAVKKKTPTASTKKVAKKAVGKKVAKKKSTTKKATVKKKVAKKIAKKR
jgi:adenylate kinase